MNFNCTLCGFKSNNKSALTQHNKTKKHAKNVELEEKKKKKKSCDFCRTEYSSVQYLKKHVKICKYKNKPLPPKIKPEIFKPVVPIVNKPTPPANAEPEDNRPLSVRIDELIKQIHDRDNQTIRLLRQEIELKDMEIENKNNEIEALKRQIEITAFFEETRDRVPVIKHEYVLLPYEKGEWAGLA